MIASLRQSTDALLEEKAEQMARAARLPQVRLHNKKMREAANAALAADASDSEASVDDPFASRPEFDVFNFATSPEARDEAYVSPSKKKVRYDLADSPLPAAASSAAASASAAAAGQGSLLKRSRSVLPGPVVGPPADEAEAAHASPSKKPRAASRPCAADSDSDADPPILPLQSAIRRSIRDRRPVTHLYATMHAAGLPRRTQQRRPAAGDFEFNRLLAHDDSYWRRTGEHWYTVEWTNFSPDQRLVTELFPEQGMQHPAVVEFHANKPLPMR